MRTRLSIFTVLTLVMGLSSASYAHEVGLLGGIDLGMASTSPSTTIAAGSVVNFTIGATSVWTLGENMGLGVDLFYMPRGQSSGLTHTTIPFLALPVTFQYYFLPEYLRAGIGPYAALAVGNVSSSTLGVSSSATLSASNLNSFDFGGVANVTGMYPVASNINLMLDVRFYLGLLNMSTATGTTTNLRDLVFTAGASYKF